MKQSGRANWILAVLVVIVAAIATMFAAAGESPTDAGARFMHALARQDADTLARMSFFNPARTPEEVLADWKHTLKISKTYMFAWRIQSSSKPTGDRCSLVMGFTRDANNTMSYEETFPLELVKRDGKWLVDVRSLSRAMYPALPR